MEKDTFTRQSSKLKVYVAGIPKTISRQELYHYFTQFGQISDITTYFNSDPTLHGYTGDGSTQQKGYCVVATGCRSTFAKILGYHYHSLSGRSVYCTKYQEGSKLMRQNRMNNQRRVIIRQVPTHFYISCLRVLLEQTIGKVEILYQFKEPSTESEGLPSKQPVKFRSYSVMFEDKSCAQLLLNLKEVTLNESTFVVEKFKPAGKRAKVPANLEQEGLEDRQEVKLSASKMDSTLSKSCGSNQPQFLGVPTDFVRPTTKMYYTLRSHYNAIKLPSNKMPAHENLRFNQQQPSLPVALPARASITPEY